MPVNSPEKSLFGTLEKQSLAKPVISLEKQALADFRSGATIFDDYAGEPANIRYKDYLIPVRDYSEIPIRIYNDDPKLKTPVLVMYPACGYILDLFESNAIACSRIAEFSQIKVILVNFRLAPENPLPISIYDAYDATKYIARHAEKFGIDRHKLYIGGLSSGAHTAAVVSNLARSDETRG